MVGGQEAFWKIHDSFFQQQKKLAQGHMTSSDAAVIIGVHPDRLREAMSSRAIAERIAQDAALGRTYGVGSTPTLFLAGRRVGLLARTNMEFWKQIAKRHQENKLN